MKIRTTLLGLGLAAAPSWVTAIAQNPPPAAANPDDPAGAPKKPAQLFRNFRELYLEGRFDLAAEALKDFLAANPSNSELIEIEKKFGATFLLNLRNLSAWSDNAAANADAKKAVETLIAKVQSATKELTQDPKRIASLIRNLGASPGERIYAEMELKRAGGAAVPGMIEVLRSTTDIPTQSGILGAIPKLSMDVVPPLLASLDGLPNSLKTGIVNAIAARQDLLQLTTRADADPSPHLWYFASLADRDAQVLRDAARRTLESMTGPIDRRNPTEELIRLASQVTKKKPNFLLTDGANGTVKLWSWDAATNNVIAKDVPSAQAEEAIGLRTLKWAVICDPKSDAAQSEFLAFATERAVQRSKFADLASANPAVHALLASAPADLLVGMLDSSLREGRPALSYGLIHGLSARASRNGAMEERSASGAGRTPVLVKALNSTDERVQFAAAIALLRAGTKNGAESRIVEVLKRAASADAAAGATAGKVIIADPAEIRSARVSELFRQAGFSVERYGPTRDLLKRISAASDVDLIVIDRHASQPLMADFLAQLRAIPSAARIPVLIVASTDEIKPLSAESLLLRLAVLIAVTETEEIKIPAGYAYDRRRPDKDNDLLRAEALSIREREIEKLFAIRLGRLERLVQAANLADRPDIKERMKIRLPQLTMAAMAAEFPITAESAPEAAKRFEVSTKLIATQTDLDAVMAKLPTADLIRLNEQLEQVLTPELQKKFDTMLRQIDPASLRLPSDNPRDPILEAKLTQYAARHAHVRVMPEPFSSAAIEQDVKAAGIDVTQVRTASDKAESSKLAVQWLKKLAVGEVAGYDVKPAESALRKALANPETAEYAIAALARIGTAEAQQDLIGVAVTGGSPDAVRIKAADAAVRHIAAYGKFASAAQATSAANAAKGDSAAPLKSALVSLSSALNSKPGDLSQVIQGFNASQLEPPAPAKPKDEKKDAPKEGADKPAPVEPKN